MRHWHRQFLGRTQLPPTLSAMAISEFFTLDGVEARAALSRYGTDMRLRSALQIGFLKMCGRPLDQLQRVPLAVLEYLSPQVVGGVCGLLEEKHPFEPAGASTPRLRKIGLHDRVAIFPYDQVSGNWFCVSE